MRLSFQSSDLNKRVQTPYTPPILNAVQINSNFPSADYTGVGQASRFQSSNGAHKGQKHILRLGVLPERFMISFLSLLALAILLLEVQREFKPKRSERKSPIPNWLRKRIEK